MMGDELIADIETLFNSLDAKITDCRRAQTENFSTVTMEFDLEQRLTAASTGLNAARARFLDKLKRSLEERLEECERLKGSEKDKVKTESKKVDEASIRITSQREQYEQRLRDKIATAMLRPTGTQTMFAAISSEGIRKRVQMLRNQIESNQMPLDTFLDQLLSEIEFTPMQADTKSIYIGCFIDLVYKNPFGIEQKVEYRGLYASTISSFELNFLKQHDSYFSNWIVMPISRNRVFYYDRSTGVLSILDSKLRILFSKKRNFEKFYKNFKVYGRRILATGMMHDVEVLPKNSRFKLLWWFDVFVEIYDLNLSLKATKKFGLARRDLGDIYKLERVSKDIFMHRYSTDEEVYTLFDFKLNKIVEHRTPLQKFYDGTPELMRTRFEPFFYDGERVQPLTARHLRLLIHSPSEMVERKKRLLNLYTSQEIEWEHLQEANKIDEKYFDYKKKPQIFLVFNLDRDTFNYVEALSKNAESDSDSYNWITVDERYKGGLTEYGDLFFIGDDPCFKFI